MYNKHLLNTKSIYSHINKLDHLYKQKKILSNVINNKNKVTHQICLIDKTKCIIKKMN